MNLSIESFQRWISQYGTAENVSTVGILLIGLFLVISIYKLLKSFHPMMMAFVIGLLACGLFLYWVRNRNEPEFMTPIVELVADFLPKEGELREAFIPK